MLCKDCVYWGRQRDGSYENGDYRRCDRIISDEYGEGYKTDLESLKDAIYWEEAVRPIRVEPALVCGEVASLRTRSTFGCVLAEQRSSS